jgi:hypothetical protein
LSQENISEFGGDPGCVTMMGHGTGAALVSLLLLSPVSQVSHFSQLAQNPLLPYRRDFAALVISSGSPFKIFMLFVYFCERLHNYRSYFSITVIITV